MLTLTAGMIRLMSTDDLCNVSPTLDNDRRVGMPWGEDGGIIQILERYALNDMWATRESFRSNLLTVFRSS